MAGLDEKIALVTGGSRGLGQDAAMALARAGADVAICGRDPATLAETAQSIRGLGRRAFCVTADLSQVAEVRRMVPAVYGHFGRVDILVNNAGINIPKPSFTVTEEDYDRIMDINVKGLFFTTQAVAQRMAEHGGGRIINIASQMSVVGAPSRAIYCASKAAVANMTRALAVEWAKLGITVNAVAPTFVDTPLTRPMFANEEFRRSVLNQIPMGRLATPEEVSAAILYLASPQAGIVTGHTLMVDGGWTAW